MLNGTGLNGDSSTTQAAVIVPKPESNSIYYIFTADNVGGPDGLQYSEVDMDLDGGLGGITSVKNVLLQTPISEKLTAVKNVNANSFWVMTHAMKQNKFYAFKVTAQGVATTPVTSNVGPIFTGSDDNYGGGYMKFSPNGKKNCTRKPKTTAVIRF
ncbi:hypothetical protein ACFQ3R_11955 [Mesonia ostreae]|uniref:Uncharacterized protein n=1 Tax=Mesonia ostreae TaxID=861110 RepID=A0ABU2KID9_9FLAO|nr:hypothetical protein [Mesonia ostreae]MDT0294481.1 hypothetical protein [Mesonia ostreae]